MVKEDKVGVSLRCPCLPLLQGAVFGGSNLWPVEQPRQGRHSLKGRAAWPFRMLKESADMIFFPKAHSFREIAAKVWNKDHEENVRKEVSFLQQSPG